MREIEYFAKVKTVKQIEGEKGTHYEVSASVAENEKGDHNFEKVALTLSFGSRSDMMNYPVGSFVKVKIEATQQTLDEAPVVEEPTQRSLGDGLEQAPEGHVVAEEGVEEERDLG